MEITEDISKISNSATVIYYDSKDDTIYRINTNGTGKKIVSNYSSNIIISPNKKFFVIFSGKKSRGRRQLSNEINIYRVADGYRYSINNVSNDHLVDVTWSPDSNSILFINENNNHIIQQYDITKRLITNNYIVDKTEKYPIYNFRFSKDNKYILTDEPSEDCGVNDGHSYKQYSLNSNSITPTPFSKITKKEFKNNIFTTFKEIYFNMYGNDKEFNPSKTNYFQLREGDIIGQNNIIYDYAGPYSPDFGPRGISMAKWISDSHIVFEYGYQIYILNANTKSVAFLTKGTYPFVFLK